MGSTTFKAAAVAMAASTALPPWRSILIPAWAAKGWLVATMPLLLITAERREGNEYFKSPSLQLGHLIGHADILAYFELIGGLLDQNNQKPGGGWLKSYSPGQRV